MYMQVRMLATKFTRGKGGDNMLKGFDISHYQSNLLCPEGQTLLKQQDFIIAKATEGKSWQDNYFDTFAEFCLNNNILFGAYHYACPEYNDPVDDATNFISMVRPYIGRCLLALDWEQEAHRHSPMWAYEWCNTVYTQTGVRPVVYCNASRLKRMTPFALSNYGLWLAHWDGNEEVTDSCEPWEFAAMKQYAVREFGKFGKIDCDVFYGTRNQFVKYQKTETNATNNPPEQTVKERLLKIANEITTIATNI